MTSVATIPAADYHADENGPSLSASIASLLVNASPLHAWTAHPKLNPDYERREDERFDVGTVCHALLLEGLDLAEVIHGFNDWRTEAAKTARAEARAAGKIPMLAHQREEVGQMLTAVRQQLAQHGADPPLFTDGKPEQTLFWEEDGVLFKARFDWLRDDYATIDDLKTTSRSANPVTFARNLYSTGADIQAAFYVRAVKKLTGSPPTFRWCVVETSPPYALSVVSPTPAVLLLAADKVERAITRWRECLESDTWPGYPTEVCYAELPAWEEARWLERIEVVE